MNKSVYEKPQASLISFEAIDIVMTSGDTGETPLKAADFSGQKTSWLPEWDLF